MAPKDHQPFWMGGLSPRTYSLLPLGSWCYLTCIIHSHTSIQDQNSPSSCEVASSPIIVCVLGIRWLPMGSSSLSSDPRKSLNVLQISGMHIYPFTETHPLSTELWWKFGHHTVWISMSRNQWTRRIRTWAVGARNPDPPADISCKVAIFMRGSNNNPTIWILIFRFVT